MELKKGYTSYAPGDMTTRYINRWSHDWNSRSVQNGEHTLRVRIRYTNGAYSDETTITLRVNNFPLSEIQLTTIAIIAIMALGAALWVKRKR